MKPRALFISPVAPDPEGKGPARRLHAVLEAGAKSQDITLLIVPSSLFPANPRERIPSAANTVRHAPAPITTGLFRRLRKSLVRRFPFIVPRLLGRPADWLDLSPRHLRKIASGFAGESFAVVHAFRLSSAPAALAVAARLAASARLHLDLDDLDGLTHARIADLATRNQDFAVARRNRAAAAAYTRAEQHLLPRFDRLYVCSRLDASRLTHREVRVLPNPGRPVQLSNLSAPVDAARPFRVLFLGTLSYYPNQDAVNWLLDEILEPLRACGVELIVVGPGASPTLQTRLADRPGLRYLGALPTSAEAFAQADAVLVPLRAGGGTRLKILEAFSFGRPVISTALGIEGIEAEPERDYLPAETAGDFVRQAGRLAADFTLREALARCGRELIAARHHPGVLEQALLLP